MPRFVIPAIFWVGLAAAAYRRWRADRALRDGLLALAAALGGLRELLMLVAEYGSHRGLFDFAAIVPIYPPLEHALELLVEVVSGYAFVASLRGRSAAIRAYLWVGVAATLILYSVSAPSWAALVHQLPAATGPRPEFAQHPADLAFRILAVAVLTPVVAALLLTRGAGAGPRLAAAAFLGFLADHTLMVANIATDLRHAALLTPIRHNLHMWAVPLLLAVYWREAVEALRRGERRQLAGQRLESLGLLAGGVAHDFGNLLAVVQTNLEFARAQVPPGGARDAVDDALGGAARARELTAQLLAYAGRGETQVGPVRLDRLAAETAHMVRHAVPAGCHIELPSEEEFPTIRADATQLRQVVMNLVINGAQAMQGRGAGTLAVRAGVQEHGGGELPGAVSPDRLPPGEYVWLEVEDQGTGMDASTLARIFDPFFSTRRDGRGLGLPVVLGIVRGHGGALTLRSEPGVGSAFRVYLPVAAAKLTTARAAR